MTEVITSLISGLIGAIIGSIIIIIYEQYKSRRDFRTNLAREKLEKLYGPLMFFVKKTELIDGKAKHILYTKEEGEILDDITRRYYYLADNDFREDILLLNSTNRYNGKHNFDNITKRIREGYNRNKRILEQN